MILTPPDIVAVSPFFIVRDVPQTLRDARWDAYFSVPDPDAPAAEFALRSVEFSAPLRDTEDGLRDFEVTDVDGYVLFFGRPCDSAHGTFAEFV